MGLFAPTSPKFHLWTWVQNEDGVRYTLEKRGWDRRQKEIDRAITDLADAGKHQYDTSEAHDVSKIGTERILYWDPETQRTEVYVPLPPPPKGTREIRNQGGGRYVRFEMSELYYLPRDYKWKARLWRIQYQPLFSPHPWPAQLNVWAVTTPPPADTEDKQLTEAPIVSAVARLVVHDQPSLSDQITTVPKPVKGFDVGSSVPPLPNDLGDLFGEKGYRMFVLAPINDATSKWDRTFDYPHATLIRFNELCWPIDARPWKRSTGKKLVVIEWERLWRLAASITLYKQNHLASHDGFKVESVDPLILHYHRTMEPFEEFLVTTGFGLAVPEKFQRMRPTQQRQDAYTV